MAMKTKSTSHSTAQKDGETQTAGAKFGLTFIMKQDAGIRRLNEISVSCRSIAD